MTAVHVEVLGPLGGWVAVAAVTLAVILGHLVGHLVADWLRGWR